MITTEEIEEIIKGDNTAEFPGISNALDAAARILIFATKDAGLENPDISTHFDISDGRKYVIKFERIDLD